MRHYTLQKIIQVLKLKTQYFEIKRKKKERKKTQFEMCAVKKYQSESGRVIYRVSDACLELKNKYRKDMFTCLLLPRHCTCDIFLKQVIIEDKMVMCRHLLAAILSDILNMFEFEQLN
ncbi:uncharacterized protein BX663DRAFT_355413 [Cokeromyces recurvatus]|uniref:uncharacterized protein n=1 Tax=Cokeromyces recurvatus TaxID=90255 RepID=UPI00221FF16C|nr:uncharacterized protein BX663DRAFT_355413 [Cokeromyces recurvatus]KAI7904095.1 hypothetical protein BX663DRAFT_355413 [Cokeromyces recurvatus]